MKKLIVANWKENPVTAKEAKEFFDAVIPIGGIAAVIIRVRE